MIVLQRDENSDADPTIDHITLFAGARIENRSLQFDSRLALIVTESTHSCQTSGRHVLPRSDERGGEERGRTHGWGSVKRHVVGPHGR